MNYAANIVTVIESIVNQMTPVLTITNVTTNNATSFTVSVCNTYWVHLGQSLTIDGNTYTVTEFTLNQDITLKGTTAPGEVTFQLDAPEFWHGSHRKVEGERAKKKNVKNPVVYLPKTRATQPGEYDSDIAYTGSIRPIFLLNYLKKYDTTELQQSKVIDPANAMADLFFKLVQDDDRFNEPERARREEWMNFGDSTVWGNDELIFDQPLSGVELQVDLEVLIYSFCDCPDEQDPNTCQDVTTSFNGTDTGVDTAAGQNIAIEVVDALGNDTGALTTNTANTKRITVDASSCDPVTQTLNAGSISLSSTPSGENVDYTLYNSEDEEITPDIDLDDPNSKVLYFNNPLENLNGVPIDGPKVGNTIPKEIETVDTDGNTINPTILTNSQDLLKLEFPDGVGDIYYNMPQPVWNVSYNTYDEGWQNINGIYANTIPSGGRMQALQNGDFYKVQFDKENKGHLYRFLGLNNGYYNSDDGNYYDENNVLSDRATVFEADDYAFDRLTGLGWYLLTNGATNLPAAFGYVATYNNVGFTDWFIPFNRQFESIVDYSLASPLYATESPIFNMVNFAKTSTPKASSPTTTGYQYRVDGTLVSRGYSSSDQIFICRDARPPVPVVIGYHRPHNNFKTTYNDYDAGYRFINNVDTYYPPDGSVPALLDRNDWYKLVYDNAFGHKHRFTGKTGGYWTYDTNDYRDVDGNVTTEILAFPDAYLIDHWTGYGHMRDRLGENDYTGSLIDVNNSTLGGFNDWLMPTMKDAQSIINYSSNQTNIWFERLPFNHILPDEGWTGTPYFSDPTNLQWTSDSDSNKMSTATYTEDTWDIFIMRLHYT